MNSKEKSYRKIDHKPPLIDFFPWKTPLSVYIDPCRMMSLNLFKKTIDGINFPEKIKVLHLFKDGEPLLHKNIIEMINYA